MGPQVDLDRTTGNAAAASQAGDSARDFLVVVPIFPAGMNCCHCCTSDPKKPDDHYK
jgi:hypothetical protein